MTILEQSLLNIKGKDIVWKPAIVPKKEELFDGLYECSNIGGLIRDVKTKRIIPIQRNSGSYRYIQLKDKNGVTHKLSVHRIIANTFCFNPNPEEYTEVNHIDGDPTNNDASNLEWLSRKLNQQHKYKVLHPKLSHFKIITADKGDENHVFKSAKEAAKKLGVYVRRINEGLNPELNYNPKGYHLSGTRLDELKEYINGIQEIPERLKELKLEEYL